MPRLFFCSFARRGRGRGGEGEKKERDMEDGLILKERIVVEEGERREGGVRWVGMMEEVKKLGILAGPMVAVTLIQYFIQVISTMMVGHLGEISLSGAALANSLTSVTGFSLLVSLPCCFLYLYNDIYIKTIPHPTIQILRHLH